MSCICGTGEGKQPQERRGLSERRDPQCRSEAEQCAERAAEEPADRERPPHHEADAGVHATEQAGWAQRLADRDLVDVVRRARSPAWMAMPAASSANAAARSRSRSSTGPMLPSAIDQTMALPTPSHAARRGAITAPRIPPMPPIGEDQADLAAAEPELAAHQQDDDGGPHRREQVRRRGAEGDGPDAVLVPHEPEPFTDVVDEARALVFGAHRPLAGCTDQHHAHERDGVADRVRDDRGDRADRADEHTGDARPGDVRGGLRGGELRVAFHEVVDPDQFRQVRLVRHVEEHREHAGHEGDDVQMCERHARPPPTRSGSTRARRAAQVGEQQDPPFASAVDPRAGR